ncbi:MAG TPA: hypothetical protein VF039_02100 [Longimicrobiales bacterium]
MRPRDPRDAFIAVVVTFLTAAALFLAVFVIVDAFRGAATAAIVALTGVALALGWVALRVVRGIELDDTGVRFVRTAGAPRFVSWDRLVAVRRADRGEVVLRGWLLPPLMMRACNASLTSIGHYRFDWAGGSAYFPPADEAALLGVLERNWGGVLG